MQMGCVKGRRIIHYVWGVRSTYERSERCLMVSFDFSNAFPTLSHAFIEEVLHLIKLLMGYVPFVLATLRTPYQFCVGRGVVREVRYRPKAGIGQGDLFSPVLFTFCFVFVLHLSSKIQGLSSYMYADDLGSIIEGTNLARILAQVQDAMTVFAKFSGQVLNLAKCGIIIKGLLTRFKRGHHGCPIRFPPTRCALFWRGGGGGAALVAIAQPLGWELAQLHLCCGGRRLRPVCAAPRGIGVGVD